MFFIGSFEHIEPLKGKLPRLAYILEQIKAVAADEFVSGTVYICEEKIKVNSEEVELTAIGDKNLEWHRKYIDIHVPLSGSEIIGWKPVDEIENIVVPYDENRDIAFGDELYSELLKINPGEFVIFNPSDGHAPCQGASGKKLCKLCVKIPVDYKFD